MSSADQTEFTLPPIPPPPPAANAGPGGQQPQQQQQQQQYGHTQGYDGVGGGTNGSASSSLLPPEAGPRKAVKTMQQHLIVSEARSGGNTNISTAFPNYGRSGGSMAGGMMGGSPKGLLPPKEKYKWHTVVDGFSK